MKKRILWSFLLTPLIFSFLIAFYLNDYKINITYFYVSIVGLTITYPLTIVFGTPAYLIFKHFNKLSFKVCVIYVSFIGALVGAILQFRILQGYTTLYEKQKFLVLNSTLTSSGYQDVLKMSLISAIAGGLGGLIFWKIGIAPSNSKK